MFIRKYRYQQTAADGMEGSAEGETAETTTNLNEGETGETETVDWRQQYAGDDESKLNQISRYASPEAAFDALLAAKERIRTGELSKPFPSEGTEDEQKAWRENNGLPDTPEGYDLSFDSGLVIGDDDKPFVDEFLKHAHETNQSPDQVKASLQWYYDNQEKQQEARYEEDKRVSEETNDVLREQWGQEYKANKNAIKGFLDSIPEEAREEFAAARMPDGTPVLSNPHVLNWMLNQALEINPASTIVPAGQNQMAGIEDEIAKYEAMMGDRSSEYWQRDDLQARYRKLIEARDKLNS